MKKLIAVLIMFPALFLGGCLWGEKVEVPQAHFGKVLTKNGFNEGVIPPSKFRLPYCIFYCNKLMLVEASDFPVKEEFRGENALFMPKSDIEMPFDIRGTFATRDDEKSINNLFGRIPTQALNSGLFSGLGAHGVIPQSVIYETYGKPVVRDVVRQVVSNYTILEVSANRSKINAELTVALNKALENTPLVARRFGLGDVRFPDLIKKQKEAAAQRRIAIQQEEAEKQIRLVKLQADLEAAKQERAIRREKAEAAAEENKIFSESVTREYIEYKKLEVLEALAKNQSATFVPFDALGSVGLSNKVFGTIPGVQK